MKNIYTATLFFILFSLHSFPQTQCLNGDFEGASLTNTPPATISISSSNAINGWTVNSGTNTGTVTSCNTNSCCSAPPSAVELIGTSLTNGFIDPNIGASYPIFSVFGSYSNPNLNPVVGNGNWFCKLNDDVANSGITKITKIINVTPSSELLRFAILPIIQNSTHTCCGLPTIKTRLMNAFTNSVISSPQLSLTSNTTCLGNSCVGLIPSFSTSPVNSNFLYTTWQIYTYDLSFYIGVSILFEITVTDCTAGDHSGYAYFDSECTNKTSALILVCPGPSPGVYSTCGNTSIPASVAPHFSPCSWNGPAGWPSNGSTATSVSLTLPGVYTVSCNPPGVCSPIIKTFTLNSTTPPSVSLTTSQSTACAGGTTIGLNGTPSGGIYSGPFVGGNSFNPSTAGNYTVNYKYSDSNGCSDSTSKTISVLSCTGIKTFEEALGLVVYPNPTTGKITITYKVNWLGFEIYNSLGEKLQLHKVVGKESVEVDLSALPDGVYFIKVGSVTRKIIKQ